MCHPDRSSSAAPSGLRERLELCLGGKAAGAPQGVAEAGEDFVLGPALAVDPAIRFECDDQVVTMRCGRRLGDPLSDYIDLWLALERFHERASLTEDDWKCLTEELQRPLKLHLAERRPATVEGALKSLELAHYLKANLDSPDGKSAGNGTDLVSGDWYRRLRNHLVDSAHEAFKWGLLPRRPEQPQASTEQLQEGPDHAEQ